MQLCHPEIMREANIFAILVILLTSRAHSWVLPFCAASCKGVKPHLSVALTTVLNRMRSAAMSRWP